MKTVAYRDDYVWNSVLLRVSALALLVVTCAAAHATSWYMSPTGSDSAAGTSTSTPFASFTKACASALPGDTIYLLGGTYYFSSWQVMACSGTSSAPITITCYPGQTAIVDGSKMAANSDLLSLSGSYINITDLQVQFSTKSAITLHNASYISVTNCYLHDNQYCGIYAYGSSMGSVNNLYLANNTICRSVLRNSNDPNGTGSWNAALQLVATTNSTVSNNVVYDNFGEGIDVCHSNAISVTGNTIYDNYSVDLYLDNATYTQCLQNFIYATSGGSAYYKNGLSAIGIEAGNEASSTYPANPCNYDVISGNIVFGTGEGFALGTYGIGGGLKNFTVSNNTFYGTMGCMFNVPYDPGTTGTVFSNNIFQQTGTTGVIYFPNGAGITMQSNCWYGGSWINPVIAGVGDVYANPQFVSPTSGTVAGFALSSTSPCIHAATRTALPNAPFGTQAMCYPWQGAVAYTQ